MKNVFLSASMTIVFFLISCKKESSTTGNSTDPLKGSWKFLTMTAHTKVTSKYTDGGIANTEIATSDYTTYNGVGIISFSDGTVTAQGIGYSVDASVFASFYADGVFIDSLSIPFSATAPPTNSSGQYKIIGTDSIYFPAGGIVSAGMPGSNNQQTLASGYKFHIVGDTLLSMTSSIAKDTLENLGGIMVANRDEAAYTVKLRRQ